MKNNLVLSLTLVVGTLLANPADLLACQCVSPRSPLDDLKRFDSVFSGKVIEKTEVEKSRTFRVKFEVAKSWKGVTDATVVLDTGAGCGDCGLGLWFTENKSYLIYAWHRLRNSPEDPAYFSVNSCSRTKELDSASEDLTAFQNQKVLYSK